MSTNHIYFDANATTPLSPGVISAMQEVLGTNYGNPSSEHWAGEAARDFIDASRQRVASLLACRESEIIFTSGGTEANNHALKGVFFSCSEVRPHFVVSQIEHPSIHKTCHFLQKLGARVSQVPVDRFGSVNPDDVRDAITSKTVLVSVMHSNNEVGTIQPVAEIAAVARERGVLFHTDAAQSVGKVPTKVDELNVDLLTLAGHKLYAPQGVGALYIRKGVILESCLHGAGHEAGRRAGTENVLEIVGLGAACQLAQASVGDNVALVALRDAFWQSLLNTFGTRVKLNGHSDRRLPNTLNVSFMDEDGQSLLRQIGGLAASTGSACHAGSRQASPVLSAMGLSESSALGAIRFSLLRTATTTEVEWVVQRLKEVLAQRNHNHVSPCA